MATPEQKARQLIGAHLGAVGWIIQDRDEMNLGAGLGVAIREYPLATEPCYPRLAGRGTSPAREARME